MSVPFNRTHIADDVVRYDNLDEFSRLSLRRAVCVFRAFHPDVELLDIPYSIIHSREDNPALAQVNFYNVDNLSDCSDSTCMCTLNFDWDVHWRCTQWDIVQQLEQFFT